MKKEIALIYLFLFLIISLFLNMHLWNEKEGLKDAFNLSKVYNEYYLSELDRLYEFHLQTVIDSNK